MYGRSQTQSEEICVQRVSLRWWPFDELYDSAGVSCEDGHGAFWESVKHSEGVIHKVWSGHVVTNKTHRWLEALRDWSSVALAIHILQKFMSLISLKSRPPYSRITSFTACSRDSLGIRAHSLRTPSSSTFRPKTQLAFTSPE